MTIENTEIKVGDTVRIRMNPKTFGVKGGNEFVVSELRTTGWHQGEYATGPGYPGGVYLYDLEVVTSRGKKRWRYITITSLCTRIVMV